MATLWLTRHGNRIDFVERHWIDTAERPFDPWLSEDGKRQARRTGERLEGEGIARIYASPFLRTVQTAQEIAEAIDAPVYLEPGVGEILFPEWFEGTPELSSFDELVADCPRLEGGHEPIAEPRYPETLDEAFARSLDTARVLAERTDTPILVVGHGASITGIVRGLCPGAMPFGCECCSLFKLVTVGTGWRAEICGDVAHVSEPAVGRRSLAGSS